jgi:hypothetical protein
MPQIRCLCNATDNIRKLMTSSDSLPGFRNLFYDALKRYHDKTKNDLFLHPLTADLQNCKLPGDILAVFDRNYNIRGLIHSQKGDQTSAQWLNATLTVLASFSDAIGEGFGLVSHQMLTCESSSLKCLFCRCSHPGNSFSLELVSSSWLVFSSVRTYFLIPMSIRRLGMLVQVTMRSSTSLGE